jgi:hypothetical protein
MQRASVTVDHCGQAELLGKGLWKARCESRTWSTMGSAADEAVKGLQHR